MCQTDREMNPLTARAPEAPARSRHVQARLSPLLAELYSEIAGPAIAPPLENRRRARHPVQRGITHLKGTATLIGPRRRFRFRFGRRWFFDNRRDHTHDLNHRSDIMDTHDARAVGDAPRNRGGGAELSLLWFIDTGDLSDESLSAGADNDRPAEDRQLAEPAEQLEVMRRGFAEADARVQQDALWIDAADACLDQPLVEESR